MRLLGRVAVGTVLALAVACQPVHEAAPRRPPLPATASGATTQLVGGAATRPVGGAATWPVGGAATWQRLPDLPLTRRDGPLVRRVGDRVVVLGGTRPQHCPVGASCPFPGYAPGGAVLDLRTSTWRRMQHPPASTAGGSPAGVTGDRLVVVGSRVPERLFVYDVAHDAWHPMPPSPFDLGGDESLTVGHGAAWVVPGDDRRGGAPIQRLDLRTHRWSTLPPSRHRPRLGLRRLFLTPAGRVVVGAAYDPATRSHTRAGAEVLAHGRWRRLTAPGLEASGWEWHWTGHRLVAPFLWGQPRTGLALDVRTGRWSRWRHPSYDRGSGCSAGPVAAGALAFCDGYVHDDGSRRFTRLRLPGPADPRESSVAWVGRRLLVVDQRGHTWLGSRVPPTTS